MPRLTPEERAIRSAQNIIKLNLESRKQRLCDRFYRKSNFYRITIFIRMLFIAFSLANLFPYTFKSSTEIIMRSKRDFLLIPGKIGASKYNFITIKTNLNHNYALSTPDEIAVNSNIVTFKNILQKTIYVVDVDTKTVYPVSGSSALQNLLLVFSFISIAVYKLLKRRDQISKLNYLVSIEVALILFYYFNPLLL